jgi:VanZ family protein
VETRKKLKWICIGILLLLLAFGLWPLEFSPKNEVTWLQGQNGLHFIGGDVISGRTVGGYVHSAGRLGIALRGHSGERGISIEIWLRAAAESKHGVPSLLSFVDDSGRVVLLLGQWRSSFIVRWPIKGYDFREKWKEIGVTDALPKGLRRLITVSSNQKGTCIYLDGKPARTFRNLNLNYAAPSVTHSAFVLGNSPTGKSSWSGDIFGLAFYDVGLDGSEVLRSFRQWINGEKNGNSSGKSLSALYLFREGAGNQVQNSVSEAVPLKIPDHPTLQSQLLGWPLVNKYNKVSFIQDAEINVIGFVPFGFFFCLWLLSTNRWTKGQTILIVIGLGVLLSLTIEFVQASIPSRDSSLADVVCNTTGTILGVTALSIYRLLRKVRTFYSANFTIQRSCRQMLKNLGKNKKIIQR